MDQSMQSDARLLWDDATDLLAGTDAPEQLVRMMASCDPQDFSGEIGRASCRERVCLYV